MHHKCVVSFSNMNVPKVHETLLHHDMTNIAGNCAHRPRLFGNFPDAPLTYQTIRTLPRLPVNFPACPKTNNTAGKLKALQKFSKLSGIFPYCVEILNTTGNFQDCPKTFPTIWNFSTLSWNFPDCPDTFKTVWKHSRLFRNFSYSLKLSRLSKLSGNCSECPNPFQTVWKLSRLSWNFPDSVESFKTFHSWVDFHCTANFVNTCKAF